MLLQLKLNTMRSPASHCACKLNDGQANVTQQLPARTVKYKDKDKTFYDRIAVRFWSDSSRRRECEGDSDSNDEGEGGPRRIQMKL